MSPTTLSSRGFRFSARTSFGHAPAATCAVRTSSSDGSSGGGSGVCLHRQQLSPVLPKQLLVVHGLQHRHVGFVEALGERLRAAPLLVHDCDEV